MNHLVARLSDALFLRLAGGDPIRADAVRGRVAHTQLQLMMLTYIPLVAVVAVMAMHRPAAVDTVAVSDQRTAVEAYAVRYVDSYLRNLSDPAALKQFFDGDVPATALPPGGRALRVSSALPGQSVDGFRTWSVVVDAELPKAANSAAMVPLSMQVFVSIDPDNLFRAVTLPAARPERSAGAPVELATQTSVAPGLPVHNTVSGFLDALLIGRGDLAPYVAAGSTLRAASPPRFSAVQIERVQTNSELAIAQDVPPKAAGVEVTVRALLQTASGMALPMDFPLRMSVAAGHWQVDAINDSPTVIPPSSSAGLVPSLTVSPAVSSGAVSAVPLFTTNAPEGSAK